LVRTVVSGVRSSWEASATKRRWAARACSDSRWAASSAASIVLKVVARRPISSAAGGAGRRRLKSRAAPMAAAPRVGRSIGGRAAADETADLGGAGDGLGLGSDALVDLPADQAGEEEVDEEVGDDQAQAKDSGVEQAEALPDRGPWEAGAGHSRRR